MTGFCLEDEGKEPCDGVECNDGQTCDPATGQCTEDDADLCADIMCEAGETCDPTTGDCVADDLCTDTVCESGEACDPTTGDCVAVDLCAEVMCGANEACDSETGDCVAVDLCADVMCEAGEACAPDTGDCVAVDLCADVMCEENEVCNSETGDCVAVDLCAEVMCSANEACDSETGDCVAVDLCAEVVCEGNETCDPMTGDCVAVDLCADVMCEANEACDPATGTCVAVDLCADVMCEANEACDPDTGDCVAMVSPTLTAQVRLSQNYALQIVELYRANLVSGSKMGRGVLYLQLCNDMACDEVAHTFQANDQYLYSTGFLTDISVGMLPPGTWHARFVLDTQYSQEHNGGWDDPEWNGISPLDALQSAVDEQPNAGFNPSPVTVELELVSGQTTPVGEVVLGSIVPSVPALPPSLERGVLLAAASGSGIFRNTVKTLGAYTYEVLDSVTPLLDGEPFAGDLCGFVEGDADTLYVIGVGVEGAYVYPYDKNEMAFAMERPAWIPHPDCSEGSCPERLEANSFPFPCRGVVRNVGDQRLLYLIEYKGAGALQVTQAYQLTVVDVTNLRNGRGGVVATYATGDHAFLSSRRIFRGIGIVGDQLYLTEPSWSRQIGDEAREQGVDPLTHVHAVPLDASGLPNFDRVSSWMTGSAEDQCGSTNNWVPGFAVVPIQGAPHLFVGNDESITIYNPGGALLGELDVRLYGKLPTSFALSPDGETLYAMPNCKADAVQASVQLGVGDQRTTLDRHAILEMDIARGLNESGVPELRNTERDFDDDGTEDGGIDLEFLHYKRDLLRWCESCTGSVPPTVYTAPEIVAGGRSVFMRGSGIQGTDVSSSGLGQVGDIGVYDLERGEGVLFREHKLWFDGPSTRWGFDLDPSNPVLDFSGDVSVSALYFLSL